MTRCKCTGSVRGVRGKDRVTERSGRWPDATQVWILQVAGLPCFNAFHCPWVKQAFFCSPHSAQPEGEAAAGDPVADEAAGAEAASGEGALTTAGAALAEGATGAAAGAAEAACLAHPAVAGS